MSSYATAAAFKQAVETRLRSSSSSGVDLARRRQLLVFDRFLARITREFGDSVMLKGGLVIELRVAVPAPRKTSISAWSARRPHFLNVSSVPPGIELGDLMVFNVAPDAEHPEITNEGMAYEGQRYRVSCALAGKPYGQPFGLDIAFADPIFGEPDIVVADDVLGFAGIKPPSLRLYPIETHIAEKFHAYTILRKRPNTRVKDLPDIALLAGVRKMDPKRLRAALEQTFSSRRTYPLARSFPGRASGRAFMGVGAALRCEWSSPDRVVSFDVGDGGDVDARRLDDVDGVDADAGTFKTWRDACATCSD